MSIERDQVIELVLRECRRLFEENAQNASRYDRERFGSFPERAVVVLSENDRQTAGWLLLPDRTEELELPTELPRCSECSGMFYSEGSFVCRISESCTTAWIDMVLGPRYGRGFEYTVSCPYGRPLLKDQRVLWVS